MGDKIQDFLSEQAQAQADAWRQLQRVARGGPARIRLDSLHPDDADVVGNQRWSGPDRPNDFAIEQLARRVVRDSAALQEAGWREDAGETLLFASMLKHVVARAVPTLYVPNMVRKTFPVDNSVPAGASTVALRRFEDKDDDTFGQLSAQADDIAEVTIQGSEDVYRLASFARGVRYSLDELEAAAFANVPLSTELLAALNRSAERVFERVSLEGYEPMGLVGVYTDSHISPTAVVTGAWNVGPATHDQIVGDCKALIEATKQASGNNYRPNRLVVPPSRWLYMSTRRPNTDLNVIQALQADYPGLQIVEGSSRTDSLDAAGTGPRMLAFTYDPDMLRIAEPRRFTLEPPEKRGFTYRIAGRQKLGGALIAMPLTVGYMDGI